jgi:CheY-like chemotaxis protein
VSGSCVLIVDESPETANLEAEIVGMTGNVAIIATTGLEALRRLATDPVDLVLIDPELPGLDGQAILGRMRADPRLRRIPVVLVAGPLEPPEWSFPVVGFLQKPFDVLCLHALIRDSLGQGSQQLYC